jgi:hypothetical protein
MLDPARKSAYTAAPERRVTATGRAQASHAAITAAIARKNADSPRKKSKTRGAGTPATSSNV